MIGGNIKATIQVHSNTGKNAIGESVETWTTVGEVLGWLDYQSGQVSVQTFNARLQDTTHIFICDWNSWQKATQDADVTSENSLMVIKGKKYNVLMIDNPMELNQHVEVFLEYVGGGQGVS